MSAVDGQPAHAPELLSIRHSNTDTGGCRNVFIEDGLVTFVTRYHKGFNASNDTKVIHRYLPREIGELIAKMPMVHTFFVVPNYLASNVDCLSILDCCYSGVTREITERASQVVSACGAEETTRGRSGGAASFSRRFFRAAWSLKANEKSFATAEDLVAEINRQNTSGSPVARLTYHGGKQPIAIPFKGTSSASVQ
ncbi:uncharacterized protein N7515_001117 [Penicillium bovifimosum]|uniref:Uncharacterized protein n=1 Tax=Penicillium bovifimosum TaxID=126998 RepID=A0A9W9HGX9_9EURO|nr:uncharacterized protein N7515_001117 [Penicillium bovifimosum]KAJ5146553.1 hypothetical protein N7515_001117 [Penicillium bovifimosum]